MALDGVEHRLRFRSPRQQHARRALRERERERVAESIGEEDLRRREHDVVLADAEYASAIGFVGIRCIVMEMDHALRPAGRAGAVHPECHLVPVRGGLLECIAVLLDPARPIGHAREPELGWIARLADVHHMPQAGCAHRFVTQQRGEVAMHDRRLGTRVLEIEPDQLGRRQRVDQHRHESRAQSAEDAPPRTPACRA